MKESLMEPLNGERNEQSEAELEMENERLRAELAFLQRSLKVSEALNNYKDGRIMLLEQDATTDKLTGVSNRQGFESKLNQRSVELEENIVVILVDADKFKPINDQLGHAAGDAVLQEIAHHLKSLVRSTDEVSRIGGDEFVVVCFGGQEEELREKFGNGVAFDMEYEGRPLSIHLSTGMVTKNPGETIGDTVRRADEKMYEFKENRGSTR